MAHPERATSYEFLGQRFEAAKAAAERAAPVKMWTRGVPVEEQAAQQITLAETPMPVLREGRVIGHLTIEAKPTEPAISQVEVHLLAQSSFGADARAITNQQHPDQQLGIDRRPTYRAIEWRQSNP